MVEAIMTLRAGVHPSGDSNGHRTAEIVLAYNTIGLVASLSVIILLITCLPVRKRVFRWVLDAIKWAAITSVFSSYAYRNRESLSNPIVMTLMVLFNALAVLLLLHKLWLGFAMVRELDEELDDDDEELDDDDEAMWKRTER
ncbi:hypothetical protein U1Q18_028193 [Sarracenia purpurea var. burkii]